MFIPIYIYTHMCTHMCINKYIYIYIYTHDVLILMCSLRGLKAPTVFEPRAVP